MIKLNELQSLIKRHLDYDSNKLTPFVTKLSLKVEGGFEDDLIEDCYKNDDLRLDFYIQGYWLYENDEIQYRKKINFTWKICTIRESDYNKVPSYAFQWADVSLTVLYEYITFTLKDFILERFTRKLLNCSDFIIKRIYVHNGEFLKNYLINYDSDNKIGFVVDTIVVPNWDLCINSYLLIFQYSKEGLLLDSNIYDWSNPLCFYDIATPINPFQDEYE